MNKKHPFLSLPPVIKCGAFDITVRVKDLLSHNGKEALGLWMGDTQEMHFSLDVHSSSHAITIVIHELNHALYWFFDLGDTTPEEQVVSCMATGWATLFKDNPELLKWIQKYST